MKKLPYKYLTLGLLVVLSFTLTACTLTDLPVIGKYFGKKPVATGPVTLNMWGLWENPDVINSTIQKYKETHPNVTINYDDRSIQGAAAYKETLFARVSSDVGADIVLVHNSWLPRLFSFLSPAPADVFDAQNYSKLFYPSAVTAAVMNNKVYGAPLYYDGLVLLYNKDHFREIGQSDPPTAWEEFRKLALELTVRSGDRGEVLVRAGAAMGAADNISHFSDILGLLFSQASVTIPDGLDTTEAADALGFYATFLKDDRVWDGSMPSSVTAFAQGKVSMIFAPGWRILDVLAANPRLNFGVAPVPQALPDKPATWASFWMEVVPATGKNQAVAWDFVHFLTSQDTQLLLFNEASKLRSFGAPYALSALADQLTNNPYLGPVVAGAPSAKSAEIAGSSGNQRQEQSMKDAVNAVLAGSSALDALRTAKAQLSK